MGVCKKNSILKMAVLPWALAGLLGMGVFAGTAFAGTKGEGQEQMLTREDIYAEYHRNVQCSVYPAPGGDLAEVFWYKVGEDGGGFTSMPPAKMSARPGRRMNIVTRRIWRLPNSPSVMICHRISITAVWVRELCRWSLLPG